MKKTKKKTTRASAFLKQKKIPFEVIQYEHEEKGAVFASQATGFPLNLTIKTLVADIGKNKYVLVLMPGDSQTSMKRVAKACGVKRAEMADPQAAERLTGYVVGGISPFGIRQPLKAVMENSLARYDTVVINAGQRGVMLKMSPRDIIKALNCTCADLVQQ